MASSTASSSWKVATATIITAAAFCVQHSQKGKQERPDAAGNPYATLGVPTDADKQTVVKAYRALALRWHPDRNSGDKDAAAVFAAVSNAYDVLTDPDKREVFDRLGVEGLERLRDGDPSVDKDWLPPDEILRRLHNDGDEPFLQSLVTSGFASLGAMSAAFDRSVMPTLRAFTGYSEFPSVVISATDASGTVLASGGTARAPVTFKFSLSGKSFDFDKSDVEHTHCAGAHFLGMKTTFYLQCEHTPGRTTSVSVVAGAFTVMGRKGTNTPSGTFELTMV